LFISLISILASALIFQMERSLINLETILFSRLWKYSVSPYMETLWTKGVFLLA